MAKAKTLVTASTIREAFRNGTLNVADVKDAKGNPVSPASILGADGTGTKVRGRLNPAFVAHFVANTPGTAYKEKVAERKTRALTYTVKDKAGRSRKREVTLTIAEVRALAGVTGKKGRLSQADLDRAGEAYAASVRKPAVALEKPQAGAPKA